MTYESLNEDLVAVLAEEEESLDAGLLVLESTETWRVGQLEVGVGEVVETGEGAGEM